VYTEDRKEAYPAQHLAQFAGILQVDGYGGFKRLTGGDRKPGPILLAFCMAHCRRKFYDVHLSAASVCFWMSASGERPVRAQP